MATRPFNNCPHSCTLSHPHELILRNMDTAPTNCSGFTAVASVNAIIVLYVVSAFREDREEVCQPAPAVGVWATRHAKERTD